MPTILINEAVDIYIRPSLDLVASCEDQAVVTMGDLHGNMIKLLFLLVKHGIASDISEETYQELVAIYQLEVNKITSEHLARFNQLLEGITFNQGTLVRLIGDELADRGSNDYFTLKLLEKLWFNHVPVEILLSNHGVEFVEAYETQTNFKSPMLRDGHAESLENLQFLIEKELVARGEILDIAERVYKPMLMALSYSLNDEDNSKITIYSHAGIGLDSIEDLANKLGVPYLDKTANELAMTIDKINQVFQVHVQANTVHTLYSKAEMSNGYSSGAFPKKAPFEFIMWNRFYYQIKRPEVHYGYQVHFVHGHLLIRTFLM